MEEVAKITDKAVDVIGSGDKLELSGNLYQQKQTQLTSRAEREYAEERITMQRPWGCSFRQRTKSS